VEPPQHSPDVIAVKTLKCGRGADRCPKTPAKTPKLEVVPLASRLHLSACFRKVDNPEVGTSKGHDKPQAEICAYSRAELQSKRAPKTSANPVRRRVAEEDSVNRNGAVVDSLSGCKRVIIHRHP
jgi:hypothetical protein